MSCMASQFGCLETTHIISGKASYFLPHRSHTEALPYPYLDPTMVKLVRSTLTLLLALYFVVYYNEHYFRLQSQIKMVQDAMACSRPKKQEISVEQIMEAKQKFLSLKTEMHSLIETYFRNDADAVREVLGHLTQLDADEYMKISLQNFRVIALLINLNIVSKNPYNDEEVKLVH